MSEDDRIAAIRRFSRFYTRRIGVLQDGLLGGPLTLAEGRVVFELAQGETSPGRLGAALGMDAGYLSRLSRGLEAAGLVRRRPDPADGRQHRLALTPRGRSAFRRIDARSRAEVAAMLAPLPEPEQVRLVEALGVAEGLLEGAQAPIALRGPRPGDLGRIIERQAALYHREYGWDGSFEGLLAGIVAEMLQRFDPAWDRIWIAHRGEAVLGSVAVVRAEPGLAKLRLLSVEPAARGAGLGTRLVRECVEFARAAGYRRMTLWTHDVLVAARAIYLKEGFVLVGSTPQRNFGQEMAEETWARDLG